jgi:hypothetical protein
MPLTFHALRSTVALALLGSWLVAADCGRPIEEYHGALLIQMGAGGNDSSLFAGTKTVQMTAEYGECIRNYYDENPDVALGTEDGIASRILHDWQFLHLCDPDQYRGDVPLVRCTVASAQETLGPTRGILAVTLKLEDDDLARRIVPLGPFPLEDSTQCASIVSLTRPGVRGYAADGTELWRAMPASAGPWDVTEVLQVLATRLCESRASISLAAQGARRPPGCPLGAHSVHRWRRTWVIPSARMSDSLGISTVFTYSAPRR